MDSGLSRSVWHTACDHIFSELCESRGVAVPDLGTFSIDVSPVDGDIRAVRGHELSEGFPDLLHVLREF